MEVSGISSHVFVDRKISNENYLMVFIRELEFQEKEYDKFEIKVNDGGWTDIPKISSETNESDRIQVETKDKYVRYKIDGRVKLNGEWINVIGATFAPISGFYQKESLPIKQQKSILKTSNARGGAIINIDSRNLPIQKKVQAIPQKVVIING